MNTYKDRHASRGFTIIELIIVIAVIGILGAIAIVSYSGSQQRAKQSSYKATAEQVKLKLGEYFTDKNAYPRNKTAVGAYLTTVGAGNTLITEFNKSEYEYSAQNCPVSPADAPCPGPYTITISKANWSGGTGDSDIIVTP